MKVRKKPVVVDAWRVSDLIDSYLGVNPAELPDEIIPAYQQGLIDFDSEKVTVATMEGVMIGWRGWWLIRGVQGEFYPCDGDIFDRTYETQWDEKPQTVLGVVGNPFSTGAPTGYQSNPEGD